MNIKYIGQCGFLITSDSTRVVTDPYLSDSVDRDHYSEKTPWKRIYPAPCTLSELDPDIVIISHEHDDHLNPDTIREYLKSGKEAFFVAPLPICKALEKLGVKDDKIVRARAEKAISIKGCEILPLPCAHTELHTDENGAFYELSYIITINGKSIFFGGDMSLYDGLTERLAREKLDLLLIPCNGRDEIRTTNGIIGNTTEKEAAKLAADLKTPFIPMHHDLYAINSCPTEDILSAAKENSAEIIVLKPTETFTL
ncbi:MAG: MBL fold metallo-hydrolase [Ruminococcaceae bacterium]|nr:MBL fold metallo-hydrolase [Oscillospiraceae bacterium]